jgi:hypothetical protein
MKKLNILRTLKLQVSKNYLKVNLFMLFLFFCNLIIFEKSIYADEWSDVNLLKNFGGKGGDSFSSVIQTSDEGFVAVGASNSKNIEGLNNKGGDDSIIIKFDKYGRQVWLNSFGGSNNESFQSVIELSGGGYVAVGNTSSVDIEGFSAFSTTSYYDAIIVKYDNNGKQIWARNFGGSASDSFLSVVETSDKYLIVVGNSHSNDVDGLTAFSSTEYTDAIMVKYDNLGNKIWAKNFGGSNHETFWSVIETSDNNLLIAGESYSDDIAGLVPFSPVYSCDGILIKYDTNGKQLWVKNFGGSASDWFYSVIETNNKDIAVAGFSHSVDINGLTALSTTSYSDAIIAKFNSNGDLLWVRNFGGTNHDYFRSITESNDGGLVVVGYSHSTDAPHINKGDIDAILVKYNSNGDRIGVVSLGDSNNEYFYSVTKTNDGGVVAVGCSNSTNIGFENKGNNDAIIIKYGGKYLLEPESVSENMYSYIIPDNTLNLSLGTNQIIFDSFSYTESLERKNILQIIVASSLPYNITASVEGNIVGANYGEKLDKSIVNIKSSLDLNYKSFSNDVTILTLFENQPITEEAIHEIDIKLVANKIKRVDVYKAVFKFEVEQI